MILLSYNTLTAAQAMTPVGPEVVWQPAPRSMQAMREACAKVAPAKYGECLVSEMPAAGAPPGAVAFTRRIQEQMGQIAYARDFREAGKVGVILIEYMLRANENQGWLLVNGNPPLMDVDDMRWLSKESMRDNPAYAALADRYPRLMLFPGDRSSTKELQVDPLPDGGERFVIRYRLLNGCHACERLASCRIGFDFDEAGRFLGSRFLGLENEK